MQPYLVSILVPVVCLGTQLTGQSHVGDLSLCCAQEFPSPSLESLAAQVPGPDAGSECLSQALS